MKCIVLLFCSAHYSTYSTRRQLILAYSHWFRNFNSVQRATHNAEKCFKKLKNKKNPI